MSMSNYLENALINHTLRNVPYTPPTSLYVALFLGDPGETGTSASEVSTSGTAYVRQAITFGAPTDGLVGNSADITYPVATSVWGTITHNAIFDAVSNGNMLFYGPISIPKTISTGDQFKYPANNLQASLA